MHYVVAMRATIRPNRNTRHVNDDEKNKVYHRTHYIPTVNKHHARDMCDALERNCTTPYSDEYDAYTVEHSFCVCWVIRTADDKRMYLDESEVQHIVSEYTKPERNEQALKTVS